jgi:hypothetical protein
MFTWNDGSGEQQIPRGLKAVRDDNSKLPCLVWLYSTQLIWAESGGNDNYLLAFFSLARRCAAHPSLVTWRPRPRASASAGTSSVMHDPAPM